MREFFAKGSTKTTATKILNRALQATGKKTQGKTSRGRNEE